MSQTQKPAELSPTYAARASESTGWSTFAGVMFFVVALVNTLWGVSALVNDDYFATDELLFGDLSLWGALYLGFSVLCFVTALLILRRSELGIVVGTVLAVLHGLTALVTIGAYPLWTVVVLVIDGLIIYGLTVHGSD
jgi:hypothetical protein